MDPGYRKPAKTVVFTDVLRVRADKAEGILSQKQIALKNDLSEAVVSKILGGEYNWLAEGWRA